jgi:hypothetical protein
MTAIIALAAFMAVRNVGFALYVLLLVGASTS